MHDISLLQDDLRYYRSIVAPAELYSLQHGECESLPLEEVIRFGEAAGLCVTRALALVLKSEWQRSLARALGVGAESAPLAEYVRFHPDKAREHGATLAPGRDATPSVAELYGKFREEGLLAGSPLAEQEAFKELVGLCLARFLFLYPAGSPELIEFACSREGAKAVLGEESGADAERYRIIHATWRELEDELATLLLRLETQTLKNERINQRWLETFGHLYIPLAESESLYSDLLAMVEHVRSNPGLSGAELAELEKELQTIHTEAGRSRKREAPLPRGSESGGGGPGGMPWSAAEMTAYDEECKALLRRIWQFTHPDRIGREGFTEAQRRRLVDCYQEAMAWKEKARLEDDEIFLAKRSTSALRMILDRVERIWEEMGLDLESTASVRGKTQEERLAWLEARIFILDEEIKEVKAEILAVGGDPDTREKIACMVSPERIEAVLAHMEERLAWYHEQIGINEEELSMLLSAGKSGGTDA